MFNFSDISKTLPMTFFVVFFSLFLSACQINNIGHPTGKNSNILITNEEPASDSNIFGQYYLSIKQLTSSELVNEIEKQKNKINSHNENKHMQAKMNLILLYSLPRSPIHNPYTAKANLNKFTKQYFNYQHNPADSALITLLKDQLNQQLSLFKQLISQEIMQEEKLQQQQKIVELEQQRSQLEQQITQLKTIEKNLNKNE